MKHLTYLFLLLLFVSCEKDETNGVPAYIKIDKAQLNNQDKIIAILRTKINCSD